jgi:hypothetical protein
MQFSSFKLFHDFHTLKKIFLSHLGKRLKIRDNTKTFSKIIHLFEITCRRLKSVHLVKIKRLTLPR